MILNVLKRDRLACSEIAVLGDTADNLAARHREELEIRRGVGDDDDAEVQLVALKLLADCDGALLMQVYVEMRVFLLETGKNLIYTPFPKRC